MTQLHGSVKELKAMMSDLVSVTANNTITKKTKKKRAKKRKKSKDSDSDDSNSSDDDNEQTKLLRLLLMRHKEPWKNQQLEEIAKFIMLWLKAQELDLPREKLTLYMEKWLSVLRDCDDQDAYDEWYQAGKKAMKKMDMPSKFTKQISEVLKTSLKGKSSRHGPVPNASSSSKRHTKSNNPVFHKGERCNHCSRPGASNDKCWTLHPELRPNAASNGSSASSSSASSSSSSSG